MLSHLVAFAVAASSLTSGGAVVHELTDPEPLPAERRAEALTGSTSTPGSLDPSLASTDPVVESRSSTALARAALKTLGVYVAEQSHSDALRRAFQAYYSFKAAHPEKVKKPYLYYVDYGLDSRTPRGYVFDMAALTLVEGPFTVAHGRGSSRERHGVPTRFSNIKDSATSSLGLYLAEETYAFSGKSAGQRYHSIGLRLRGLSGSFNSAARARGIVVHGAPYVTPAQAGRSEGCPAMEESRAQRLIPKISNGGLLFLFSPHDPSWMRQDPWSRSTG